LRKESLSKEEEKELKLVKTHFVIGEKHKVFNEPEGSFSKIFFG